LFSVADPMAESRRNRMFLPNLQTPNAGRFRLIPNWHARVFMVSFMALNAIVQIAFRWNEAWDAFRYLMLTMLIICAAFAGYLFYVRHHEGHFWDEEEARRQNWDRRGRRL
jgi:uncharacterized membrane protein